MALTCALHYHFCVLVVSLHRNLQKLLRYHVVEKCDILDPTRSRQSGNLYAEFSMHLFSNNWKICLLRLAKIKGALFYITVSLV